MTRRSLFALLGTLFGGTKLKTKPDFPDFRLLGLDPVPFPVVHFRPLEVDRLQKWICQEGLNEDPS